MNLATLTVFLFTFFAHSKFEIENSLDTQQDSIKQHIIDIRPDFLQHIFSNNVVLRKDDKDMYVSLAHEVLSKIPLKGQFVAWEPETLFGKKLQESDRKLMIHNIGCGLAGSTVFLSMVDIFRKGLSLHSLSSMLLALSVGLYSYSKLMKKIPTEQRDKIHMKALAVLKILEEVPVVS